MLSVAKICGVDRGMTFFVERWWGDAYRGNPKYEIERSEN
jgi:hypothetical protein